MALGLSRVEDYHRGDAIIEAMELIIFDFDGTIADSLRVFVAAANRLAKQFCYPPVPESDIPLLRSLSSREILKQLPFPRWQLPFYIRSLRREVKSQMDQLQLFDGIAEILVELKAQGYVLGIVTSNSRATVQDFLKAQKLDHLFEFVYGGQLLLGKERILRQLARRSPVKSRQVICIGDETRDIEAAKQANLLTIAVSWGFNSRSILEDYTPSCIVDHPEQLLAAIKNMTNSANKIVNK